MIELADVGVTFRKGGEAKGAQEVTALRDVSLRIPAGDFVFLVGPTGAGKSTLLRLLYRDLAPTRGEIRVAGMDLARIHPGEIPALRRRMGIVLQDYGLLPQRTAWENVAFAGQVIGLPRRDLRHRVLELLEMVGMTARCDAFPHELSGGEQQRVAIARALVGEPKLLITDEPTGNLDPETGEGIMRVLLEANRRGATVVCATHDRLAVDTLRRRVVAVAGGTIVRDDPEGMYA